MERRAFLRLMAFAATALPISARSQPSPRARRIAVFMDRTADDPEANARLTVFK
jgi:hypothetical protein